MKNAKSILLDETMVKKIKEKSTGVICRVGCNYSYSKVAGIMAVCICAKKDLGNKTRQYLANI